MIHFGPMKAVFPAINSSRIPTVYKDDVEAFRQYRAQRMAQFHRPLPLLWPFVVVVADFKLNGEIIIKKCAQLLHLTFPVDNHFRIAYRKKGKQMMPKMDIYIYC